jgi:ribosome recycling factor
MEDLDDILLESEDKMDKAIEFLQEEMGGLRTGKASPSLVENVNVDYYGTATRLRELAGIATPEPRLIVINPYDPSSIQAIEKAILAANVGVTPVSDGRVVRIPIPELSEERRVDLTKVAKKIAEEQRIAVRNIRRDANEHIKHLQKDGKISEDEREQALKDVQEYTDDHIKKIDELLDAKEKDIMEV